MALSPANKRSHNQNSFSTEVFLNQFRITSYNVCYTKLLRLYETARNFMFWVVLTPLITVSSFVWDGIYIGVTASREMRNSMLAATLLVFAPSFYFLQDIFGNHALWLAMMLFMLARGVFQTILFPKVVAKSFRK